MERVKERGSAQMGWACSACYHPPGNCRCGCPEHKGLMLFDEVAAIHGVLGVLQARGYQLEHAEGNGVG